MNMALVNGGFLHYRDLKKFLKNLLRNCWSDFDIISQECSFGNPFQKVFAKFWFLHKHGSGEWGLLALYRHKEILVNSSLKATKNWLEQSKKIRWVIQGHLGPLVYEIHGLKNDCDWSMPSKFMMPRCRSSFWHVCVSLEVIKFAIQQIHNSGSSRILWILTQYQVWAPIPGNNVL